MIVLIFHGALVIGMENIEGVHAIHIAAANGFPEIVNSLLDAGVDINEFGTVITQVAAPLHHAAYCGNFEVVQLLLNRGANVLLDGRDKRSVMVYATYSGDQRILDLLLASCVTHTCRGDVGKSLC